MTIETRFTRLFGCTVPIQLAGMGGVSTPELAAAVSRAGALAMMGVGAVPLPTRLDAFERLGGGPCGVNFLAPFLDRGELDATLARVPLVEIFWATPDPELVARIHDGGARAGWQVGSVDEARAAVDAGCDLVIAQGVEAGGHVRGEVALLPLLAGVVDAIGDDAVVVAAGGIGSARAVAAVLAAGADAVRVGTRFVASAESPAHPDYKAALVEAGAGDTVLNTEFGRETGWPDAPNRVLRGAFDAATRFGGPVVGHMRLPGAPAPMDIPPFSTLPPTVDCDGDIGAMALYAGQSVGAVTRVQPAAEIVRELCEGLGRVSR